MPLNPYRVPVMEQFEWQQPVISATTTAPPGAPSKGDRYIVPTGATGVWSTHVGEIAYCSDATGPVWSYTTQKEGMIAWVKDKNKYYDYNGTAWRPHNADDEQDARRYALLVGAP